MTTKKIDDLLVGEIKKQINNLSLLWPQLSAPAYEAMMELIDDIQLLEVVKIWRAEESVKVSLVDLWDRI